MASVAHIIRRRRRRRALRRQARAARLVWTWIIVGVAALLLLGPLGVILGGAAVAYARALSILPTPQESITLSPVVGPTEIYDSTGQTLLFSVEDPMGDRRAWIPLNSLPPYVAQATLLVEDPDFLDVTRFNPFNTISRLWTNLLEGPLEAEQSITARLVRNVIAPPADFVTVEDRAREIALVAEINRLYTPAEVLEWHLNTNYYGNMAYGIEAAAQIYLGKSAQDLTLDEAALLTAIPTATQYNPVDDETAARQRQADVLRRLLAAGQITQNQFEQAFNRFTPLAANAGQSPLVAAEFAIYARRQAEHILTSLGRDGAEMVSRGGLRIVTTLDLDLYYQSECALRAHLERLAGGSPEGVRALNGEPCFTIDFLPAVAPGGGAPPDSGVIVIIEANSGQIRSMVGQATRAAYQPGPTLHPFVYLDGFASAQFTPATMVQDIPQTFPGAQDGLLYIPNNPDGQFRGPMNLRDAMGLGLLPPVVQVAHMRGLNSLIRNTANRMGINSLTEGVYDLSLLERGGVVSVLDVTFAYSVFATLGEVTGIPVQPLGPGLRAHDPVAVMRIEDAAGNSLWQYDEEQIALGRTPLLEAELPYLINHVLSDVTTRRGLLGSDNALELSRPAAAVNGVTGDRVDNWTVGYTPQVVAGVRLGRAGGGAMTLQPFALEGAASVWHALMEYVHLRDGLPVLDWTRPGRIVDVTVCEVSGLLPNGICPTRSEIFADGTQPFQVDTHWQVVEVNSQTGQRATANTDNALRRQDVYFIPPDSARDWWRANNRPLPPEEFDSISRPDILSSAVILQPAAYAYVGGVVDIRGSLNPDNMQYYRVVYGQGVNPTEWIDITGQQTSFVPGTSLARWDTTGLDGLYNLQLQVVRNDNTLETSAAIQVTVDNIPPTIALFAGEPGQAFRWPTDTIIPLRTVLQDNIYVDYVVFYHNGQEIGRRTDCRLVPDTCGFDFQINRTGAEVFTAVVYDGVGNSSTAEIVVEVVRDN